MKNCCQSLRTKERQLRNRQRKPRKPQPFLWFKPDPDDSRQLILSNGTRLRQAYRDVGLYLSQGGNVYALTRLGLRNRRVNFWKKRTYCHRLHTGRGCSQGQNYPYVDYRGRTYRMHQLMACAWLGGIADGMVADHINGDIDDFRMANLRIISVQENDRCGGILRRLRNASASGSVDTLDAVDAVTDKAVKISSMSPFYDAAKYMKAIMLALPDVYDEAFYSELKKSFNDCLVAQAYSSYLTERNYQVDYSVLLGAFGHYRWGRWNTNPVSIPYVWSYEADGTLYEYEVMDGEFDSEENYYCQFLLLNRSKWAGTLESTYGQTAFDQAVGWSRWLMLNHHEPSMWSKSGFEEELDADDE